MPKISVKFLCMKVHAKHILVETKEAAQDILDELKEGASFDALAKKHSKCPSGADGGNLGWFEKGRMVKEFEDAAFNLEKDQISEPVKTQFGWYIIKVVDKK